jgi:hypothetical protein
MRFQQADSLTLCMFKVAFVAAEAHIQFSNNRRLRPNPYFQPFGSHLKKCKYGDNTNPQNCMAGIQPGH